MSSGNPFSIGFRAARANLVPGLIIQALMVPWCSPITSSSARSCFQLLAAAKAQWGYAFSFAAALIAGAVLPSFSRIAVQRGRFNRADFSELFFLASSGESMA